MSKSIGIIVIMSILVLLAGCKYKADNKFLDYKMSKLDNGLNIITVEDFSSPIVAVQIWYNVGSKDEDPNLQGFAHMFEHIMFRRTELIGPDEHFSLIRSVGGTTNGYTSFDRTVYLETLPANQIDLGLWLEAQRMAFLSITDDDFQTERNVVLEELRMRLNEPYGTSYEKIFAQVFQKSPYRWMPIGQIAHLRSATISQLRDFWQNYYGPNNATLIIVGAVKHNDAKQLAEKYFGWIKSEPVARRDFIKDAPIKEPKTIVIKGEKAPAPVAGIGYRTVPASNYDSIKLDLLADILGSGKSSRIHKILVDDKKLAVAAESASYSLKQDGIFGIGAVVNPVNPQIEQVIEILKSQITDIKTNGITVDELTKAKNKYLKSLITQNLTVENKAKLLGTAALDIGDVEYVNNIIPFINTLTVDSLIQTANKYFNDNQLYTVIIEQNTETPPTSINSQQEDAPITAADTNQPNAPRAQRPEYFPEIPPINQISNLKLNPQIHRKTLDNGLKIISVPNNEVPYVSMFIGFDTGAWADTKDGVCNMTVQLAPTATKKMTAEELNKILDISAISIGSSCDIDNSSISANCLTEHIDLTAKLLADIVIEPLFDVNEFANLQKQAITSMNIQMQSPEFLAETQFNKVLFANHPYSKIPQGLPDDINNITASDCAKFWQEHFSPSNAVIIIAGDITADAGFKLVDKYFGKWQSKQVPSADFAKPKAAEGMKIYIYDVPQSPQSRIMAGSLSITRAAQPQYFVSRVVSDYFGFSFNSRLNRSLRVDKGLTYGAFGGYTADKYAGKFFISTFTKTQSTADAVKAIIEQVESLTNTPVDSNELSQSKAYMLGSFILHRQTPQEIARDLWLIESQNLGDDYLDRLLAAIAGTTETDCIDLIKQTIRPEDLQIVVVGDAETLKPQLSQIAPVIMIN